MQPGRVKREQPLLAKKAFGQRRWSARESPKPPRFSCLRGKARRRRRIISSIGLKVEGTARLKALEEENRQLKRLVADQALNLQVVKDLLGKKW